jgi:dTDP-4-dehydrorhamnose 3,5-epimerase
VIDLVVHGDARGWFKENWQRAKMTALGVPDFNPVQNNVAHNAARGTTRGFHAEPWDKLVSVAAGRVFAAWVDLRDGSATFGRVVTCEVGRDTAVFVPRGVANAYQALEDGTVYSYLVNEHWSQAARSHYSYVNLADPALGVAWPIPLDRAEVSAADRAHPALAEARPVAPRRVLVVGADGQLGQELMRRCPGAVGATQADFDFLKAGSVEAFDWSDVGTVINAAAYTAVDRAESDQGRRDCWAVNAVGVARLVAVCRARRITLVHISSDYVFDGSQPLHTEDEPPTPLGVYGQTKAAADAVVATLPDHLILRTSWLTGAGPNFVRTMARLAREGATPSVVADQDGRLTFTADLAAAALHLLRAGAAPGVYNASNSGPVVSWHQVARRVFELCGRDPADVRPVTTEQYLAGRPAAAPRPRHSAFDLSKLEATGFTPPSWESRLTEYVASITAAPDADRA